MSDLVSAGALSRYDAETFLYHEAALLDNWKLREWANLFTDDGEYLIPPLDDPDGQPGSALFLVLDDRHRLGERANRLLKRNAHAEFPHAETRRWVSKVDVQDGANGTVPPTSNFVLYPSPARTPEQPPRPRLQQQL